MAAYASLDDVNRILGYTTGADNVRDARVDAALDAVESWADSALWKISAAGQNVEVYFDVADDATLYLPAHDVTVTKVKIIPSVAGDEAFYFTWLNSASTSGQGYDMDDQGRIFLRPSRVVQPFEGARSESLMRHYDRVEVHYIGTGVIPRAVTEGIAYLAAGYFAYGKNALTNLKKEKIGDYSYELGGAGIGAGEENLPYLQQAEFFLRPYMRRQRVQVT